MADTSTTTAFPPVTDKMHPAGVVVLTIIAIYGTIGNIFIIGAVSLQKRLRVRGNAFVVNLAVADLIVCAYIMPLGLVSSQYKEEPFGEALCDFNGFLLMTSCGVSTQTLMFIAVERYFHVCKMDWYRRFFTPMAITVYIAVIWIYTGIWTIQGLTGWSQYVYGPDVWLCIVDGTYRLSYNICLSFFGMVLPMIVLSFCYLMIFRVVHKSRKRLKAHRAKLQAKHGSKSNRTLAEQKKQKKEQRLILMLFIIVVLFCLFWTPAAIVIVFSAVWKSMPRVLYTFSIWMALTNSSFNSIVYGLMNQNFRTGYLALFNKIFCSCMSEDRKVKCLACKKFLANSQDDSTSASQQTRNTGKSNNTTNNTAESSSTSGNKHVKRAVIGAEVNTTESLANENPQNNNNIPKPNSASRPPTVKTVRSVNEVTVRSESKISLKSNISIGSMDDESTLVGVEGTSESALLRALGISGEANDNFALETIPAKEGDENEVMQAGASTRSSLNSESKHSAKPKFFKRSSVKESEV